MYQDIAIIIGHAVTMMIVGALVVSPLSYAKEGVSYDEGFYSSNDILYYNPTATACVGDVNSETGTINTPGNTTNFAKPGTITLSGANNAERVMNFLLEQGFPLPAASGMMGNFSVESGFDPVALNAKSGAYGLAQWLGSRKSSLQSYGGAEHNTIAVQVQFLMHELETTEKASMAVKNETDPIQAAVTWELKFERSGQAAVGQRSGRAKKIFDEWTKNKSLSDAFLKTIDNATVVSTGSGSGLTNSNCSPGGSGSAVFGSAELEGYAFPIALKKKSDLDTFGGALNKLPCLGTKCHHDGTYAFDLGVKGYGAKDVNFNPNSIGAPVFAISDGTITRRSDNPNATRTNCTQFTLTSSKDNHAWWYGHLDLKGAAVTQGQKVKAGQLLGYVGPSNCADNTAPHLHIDSGGGLTGKRNELVSKVINGLYTQIGN